MKKTGRIISIKDAQAFVADFAKNNGWDDVPNMDKFDHLHEELIEMSQHLRYKSMDEKKQIVQQKKDYFTKEMGDLFFGMCRLANQLGLDIEEGFNQVKEKIVLKYANEKKEINKVRE